MKRIYLLTGILLCLTSTLLRADTAKPEQVTIAAAGTEVPVDIYHGMGRDLLLWLPAEFGVSPRQAPTAQALAAAGVTVWMPNLHDAIFVPPGRYSLVELDTGILKDLIQKAAATGKNLYLMAPGRAAALGLIAIRQWQSDPEHGGRLMGAILLHPKLFVRTPQGGEEPEYLPAATASNIPLYLFQPSNSASYWRVGEFRAALEQGGAPVFMHRLQGVGDGFNRRNDIRPGEQEMTERLPVLVTDAMRLLAHYGPAPANPTPLNGEAGQPEGLERSELLKPLQKAVPAPPLVLNDLAGKRWDLAEHRGKVVLVNFWATWCPPCIKELPALARLTDKMRGRPFQVLTVDVGEDPATIRPYLADKGVNFPVLLDPEGEAFKAWQAYAFPTTMILDRDQRVRYAVFGALEWDGSEVIQHIEALIGEQIR